MKRILFALCLSLLLADFAGARVAPHRSWQFHDRNWDYLQNAIPQAATAGMNRIQLSHDIIMDAEQLWGDDDRVALINRCIALAHEHDLAVDLWTHELSGVPADYLAESGKARLDDALWQHLRDKYERVFNTLPGLDGLVLTFAETDFAVFMDSKVESDAAPLDRLARLIDLMAEVCAAHDAELIVRTFLYMPHEIVWLQQALTRVRESIGPRDNITIMSKCVPHDWQPYYPYNPALGHVGGFPQIVEIDLGHEFTGKSQVLYGAVDYIKRVMDYAYAHDCVGAVARVERMTHHALGTPNEVNLAAFSRLLHEPDTSADALWQAWATKRYGAAAAPDVTAALRRTFDIVNLSFFPLEQWAARHSRLPGWGYAFGHIEEYGNAKWIASPAQEHKRDALLTPDWDTLDKLELEKEVARRLVQRSLADLADARPLLDADDYQELYDYLENARITVEVFRHHILGLVGARFYQQARQRQTPAAELQKIQQYARRHAGALKQWADRIQTCHSWDYHPSNPGRIRAMADDILRHAE